MGHRGEATQSADEFFINGHGTHSFCGSLVVSPFVNIWSRKRLMMPGCNSTIFAGTKTKKVFCFVADVCFDGIGHLLLQTVDNLNNSSAKVTHIGHIVFDSRSPTFCAVFDVTFTLPFAQSLKVSRIPLPSTFSARAPSLKTVVFHEFENNFGRNTKFHEMGNIFFVHFRGKQTFPRHKCLEMWAAQSQERVLCTD
jgi:hypothetical protein